MIPEKLQRAIHQLLQNEPYFAHFILNSKVIMDKYGVPTAGVASVSGVPTFVFNSKWISDLTADQVEQVVKHEVLHASLGHVYEKAKDPSDHKLRNIAQDCAINQYLRYLPNGCVTLESLSQAVGEPLEPFQTSDYYYDKIINCKAYKEAQAGNTLDDHDMGIPGKDSPEVAKAVMNGAAKKATIAAAGNAPQAIMQALEASGLSQVPWKRILRNFVLSQVSNLRKSTTKRIHRRFALPVPGTRKDRTLTLALCVDESGSMSDEQLSKVVSEIQAISKQVTKTYLIHADCTVSHVEEIKPGFKFIRRSGGGTAYQPAIDKAVSLGADVIVYFGDFDCADTPVDPQRAFLWVGVVNTAPPASFGQVLILN